MDSTNNYFLVLDIETSTETEYDPNLKKEVPRMVWLSYGVCKLFSIRGKCLDKMRFRKWEELSRFLLRYNNQFTSKLICYVHNLSYEFDFLIKNISKPKNFICNNSHSVISAVLESFPKIEFRCSYQLSKLPLAKIGELFSLPKLESEYRTIYPEDDVTEEEWIYCERDCDIIVPYILNELKEYKLLSYIPLTSTGRVRKKLKSLLSDYSGDWDTMIPDDCYYATQRAFRGGLTMSNPRYTSKIISKKFRCFDEKSKYPGVMLTEKYPRHIRKISSFTNETANSFNAWIGRVIIRGMESRYDWGAISLSTCESCNIFDSDIFNGKIINSGMVELYITNVDLEYINKVYAYDSIDFIELYECYDYDYLPQPFIKLILEYADAKSKCGKHLKEVKKEYGEHSEQYREAEREYMESKAKLNGIYGMMVQKLIQDEWEIDDNFIWKAKEQPYKYIEGKHMSRNFLFGIFITAYSRRDLVLNIIHNCPFNFVYCDTDSIKFIDIGDNFEDLNKEIPAHLQEYECIRGFNRFEEEEGYDSFLTYGAKKYAYEKDGVFSVTVAGLPKGIEINSYDDFKLGTRFKNCKLAKRYIYHGIITDIDVIDNEVIMVTKTDGEIIDNGGVGLYEVDYTLNMTKSDLEYIRRRNKSWEKRKSIPQNTPQKS